MSGGVGEALNPGGFTRDKGGSRLVGEHSLSNSELGAAIGVAVAQASSLLESARLGNTDVARVEARPAA